MRSSVAVSIGIASTLVGGGWLDAAAGDPPSARKSDVPVRLSTPAVTLSTKKDIESLALSSDATTLVTAEVGIGDSPEGITLRTYDFAKGLVKREFGSVKARFVRVAFLSGERDWLLSQALFGGRQVVVWNASAGTRRSVLDDRLARTPGLSPPDAFALSSPGSWSGSREVVIGFQPSDPKPHAKSTSKLKVVDASSGRELADLPLDWDELPAAKGRPHAVVTAFSADGLVIAAVLNQITDLSSLATYRRKDPEAPWTRDRILVDTESLRVQTLWEEARFTRSGRCVVAISPRAARAWDVLSGEKLWIREADPKDRFTGLAIAPDADVAALATRNTGVQLVDVASGDTLRKCADCAGSPGDLEFTPDGRRLLAAAGRMVVSWDLPAE